MNDAIKRALHELRSRDPRLAVLIEKYGPLRIRPPAGGFADLVHTIIGHQLSDRAALTTQTRGQALFPDNTIEIDHLNAIDDTALRAAGLSMQKISFIRKPASHISR